MEDLKDKIKLMEYDILGLGKVIYTGVLSADLDCKWCEVACLSSCYNGGMCGSCKERYTAS